MSPSGDARHGERTPANAPRVFARARQGPAAGAGVRAVQTHGRPARAGAGDLPPSSCPRPPSTACCSSAAPTTRAATTKSSRATTTPPWSATPPNGGHGARRHIVDRLENVTRHFGEGALDLIVCNGVFGWGLDDPDGVDEAFRGCHRCLRAGGVFVLGLERRARAASVPARRVPLPCNCSGPGCSRPWPRPNM